MICAGTIAAAVMNSAGKVMKDGTRPVEPLDFVPDWEPKPKQARREQTIEEQIKALTQFFGCGPGKPN